MTSLREVSGFDLGRMPTRASSGAVSSKIRPFDNAMLMLAMFHPAITLQISSGGAFYRKASADALDARPEGRQLLLQRFVAAVEVVDAVDQGLAFGAEAGYDQPRRGAQVGGHDGRALQALDAAHESAVSLDRDIGAQALQLERVHEAILEDRLGDHRRAVGDARERHELRLHVGGK